ncbi:MAG: hypothetical protein ACNA7V_01825 [Bacteroidales bacterium]
MNYKQDFGVSSVERWWAGNGITIKGRNELLQINRRLTSTFESYENPEMIHRQGTPGESAKPPCGAFI